MNRRTVLQVGATSISAALAGCVDSVPVDLEFTTPIPINVRSEASSHHYLTVEAFEMETGRQSYRKEIAIRPDERADLPHLDTVEQRVRFAITDREVFEEITVTEDTQSLEVVLTDDELRIQEHTRG